MTDEIAVPLETLTDAAFRPFRHILRSGGRRASPPEHLRNRHAGFKPDGPANVLLIRCKPRRSG